MNFSFELSSIKCNAVLSTKNSPWGENDGIRLYFLVFDGNGHYNLMVSGREYPPPDVVDSYSLQPGDSLDLRSYPPTNAPSWESDLFDVDETDYVWVAVIGINEGIAYPGGGGGGTSDQSAFMTGVQEFVKYAASKGFEGAPTDIAVGASFAALNSRLDALNASSDCRGVAFAYEIVFSGKQLLFKGMQQRIQTLVLGDGQGVGPLAIINQARTGCGAAKYEVPLTVTLRQQPMVNVKDAVTSTRTGPATSFAPRFSTCQDQAKGAEVWPIMYDRAISFTPNFFFATIQMIWRIEDTEIHQLNGSLRPTTESYTPVDGATVNKPVKVDFEVATVGGINQLTLKTSGDDGDYSLKVGLLLKFFDNQAPMIFYEEDVPVWGQDMTGNQAYKAYIGCLIRYHDFVRRHVNIHLSLDPGTPVEQIIQVEDDLVALTKYLAGEQELT